MQVHESEVRKHSVHGSSVKSRLGSSDTEIVEIAAGVEDSTNDNRLIRGAIEDDVLPHRAVPEVRRVFDQFTPALLFLSGGQFRAKPTQAPLSVLEQTERRVDYLVDNLEFARRNDPLGYFLIVG
ncbi:MAG TPA: hypothetical protein VH482_28845 [Thermomicrobiales bacterium]